MVITTLESRLRGSKAQAGDDNIKEALARLSGEDFKMLDIIISNLMATYPLEQIYKVYYQNFD